MRVCAVIALLLCLTPLAANERLTDEQILAKLDEATASEARWILRADFFATGAIGIDGHDTRGCIAYQRLLRTRDPGVFALLSRSNNDAAVCFGIEGVAELAPQTLSDLLAHVIGCVDVVPTGSGSIYGETGAASRLLHLITEHGAPEDKRAIVDACKVFLAGLETQPARITDHWIAGGFKELLGAECITGPTSAYLQVNHEDWNEGLRRLAKTDKEASGRLALQRLAADERVVTKSDTVERVWLETLEGDDDILDLQIHAEYWDRVVSGLNRVGSLSIGKAIYNCPWHGTNWEWLEKHENQSVRSAAARLKNNPIAGWKGGADIPEDPTARRHAKLCTLYTASTEENYAARAAYFHLFAMLLDKEQEFPLVHHWDRGQSSYRFLAELLGKRELPGRILSKPMFLALSGDWNPFIAAVRLVAELLDNEAITPNDLAEEKGFVPMLERLSKFAKEPDERGWESRLLLQAIFEQTADILGNVLKEQPANWRRWMSELGKSLVNNPRVQPPKVDPDRLLDRIIYSSDWFTEVDDERGGQLVRNIFEGGDDFLLDDEQPNRKPEECDPTPAVIYKRMQEAAARLD